jgi:hypothetical protein
MVFFENLAKIARWRRHESGAGFAHVAVTCPIRT